MDGTDRWFGVGVIVYVVIFAAMVLYVAARPQRRPTAGAKSGTCGASSVRCSARWSTAARRTTATSRGSCGNCEGAGETGRLCSRCRHRSLAPCRRHDLPLAAVVPLRAGSALRLRNAQHSILAPVAGRLARTDTRASNWKGHVMTVADADLQRVLHIHTAETLYAAVVEGYIEWRTALLEAVGPGRIDRRRPDAPRLGTTCASAGWPICGRLASSYREGREWSCECHYCRLLAGVRNYLAHHLGPRSRGRSRYRQADPTRSR